MNEDAIYVLRYDEIGLKGGNRRYFENVLARHVTSALKECSEARVRIIQARLLIEGLVHNPEYLEERLKCIPGLHSFSRGFPCPMELEAMKTSAAEAFRARWDGKTPTTFRITTKRSYKVFPIRAEEVNAQIGAHLINIFGSENLKVQLKDPEIEIILEIQKNRVIVYDSIVPCLKGLPVGTAGRHLCLLSGGIDSPVAAFNMMRRGCEVDHIFFENRVFLGRAAYDKVLRLARTLNRYQSRCHLFVVPFSDIQVAIRDNCIDRNRVVLYRRFMYRIAERVAARRKHLGLINGECLGQVASQTLENINAVNDLVKATVHRPLIALDKVDIMATARTIGTFNISIEDAPDCCSVFMPDRPATRAKLELLEKDEAKLDVEGLVNSAIEKMEDLLLIGEQET